MKTTINVRPCCGAYLARAIGVGGTASSTDGPKAAARAVCRTLKADLDLLEQVPADASVTKLQHPDEVGRQLTL